MASPGRPLPADLRREAETFYQNDLSPVRVHDDAVAQRATAALGARAMTVGSHIFLPPKAAGDKSVVGHELSHASSNLAGVRETGDTNGAGVTVTDPRQDSEQRAETDGTAFAAGAGRAPSAGSPTAPRTGGGGGGGPVVARVKSTPGGKGKGAVSGQLPGREEIIAEVDRLAKACTCKQSKKQWGRITKDVVIRYARDYKDDRDGQSLRHLTRQMLNAMADEERKAREGTAAPAGGSGKKETEPVKEQEIQAALVNGHLVFASNCNQSMFRLHELLKELSGEAGGEEDLEGGEGLQKLMTKDFGVRTTTRTTTRRKAARATPSRRPSPSPSPRSCPPRRAGASGRRLPRTPTRAGSGAGPNRRRRKPVRRRGPSRRRARSGNGATVRPCWTFLGNAS
ncbi:hypothetical protein CUT44_03030 [Streptomyces carminius]|uniref:eCIS core domain-containing protein n=2 Tax=Streptomyces carminius TaxID=2665496 RepID=A0A2M8M6F4_9ACTN|nr:hypothetical protein CUT44_03030 [Streptomyces carminius]